MSKGGIPLCFDDWSVRADLAGVLSVLGRLEMGTKTPPPEPLNFGGGDRLVVALVGISTVAIQR